MIRINLAPPEPPARRMRAAVAILATGAVAAAILVGLGWWYATMRRAEAHLAGEIAILSRELTALRPAHDTASRARQAALDLARREQAIHALARGQGAMIRALDGLLDAVPRDVSLAAIDGRGLDLRAAGSAASPRAVADFTANLRASGIFRDVEIVLSRRDLGKAPPEPLSFEITCRVGS